MHSLLTVGLVDSLVHHNLTWTSKVIGSSGSKCSGSSNNENTNNSDDDEVDIDGDDSRSPGQPVGNGISDDEQESTKRKNDDEPSRSPDDGRVKNEVKDDDDDGSASRPSRQSSSSPNSRSHHRKQSKPLDRQQQAALLLLQHQQQQLSQQPSPARSSSSLSQQDGGRHRLPQDLSSSVFPPRPGDTSLLNTGRRGSLQPTSCVTSEHDDIPPGGAFFDGNPLRSNGNKLGSNRLLSSGSAAVNAATAAAAAAAALMRGTNATQLQQQQQQQQQHQQQQPSSGGSNQTGPSGGALVPMWKDREVIALLELYASDKYQTKFRDPRNRKIFVWSEISNEINSQFFTGRTGMHCDQKFRNIKSAYKHRVLTNPNVSYVVRTNPIFQVIV